MFQGENETSALSAKITRPSVSKDKVVSLNGDHKPEFQSLATPGCYCDSCYAIRLVEKASKKSRSTPREKTRSFTFWQTLHQATSENPATPVKQGSGKQAVYRPRLVEAPGGSELHEEISLLFAGHQPEAGVNLGHQKVNFGCDGRDNETGGNCAAEAWPGESKETKRERTPIRLQVAIEEVGRASRNCESLTLQSTEPIEKSVSMHLRDRLASRFANLAVRIEGLSPSARKAAIAKLTSMAKSARASFGLIERGVQPDYLIPATEHVAALQGICREAIQLIGSAWPETQKRQ